MLHALVHGAPICLCWAVVGSLAVAAGCNHLWHHGRHHDPTVRLARERERGPADAAR